MNKMLARCPVCAGDLHVTEVSCGQCGTKVQSEFEPCRFCRLSVEQLHFVELLLRSRGNLTSVGDELDISYPTVTRRLEAIIAALEGGGSTRGSARADDASRESDSERRAANRRMILEMLDRGEITADDATRQLSEL